ncbi:MAG: di-trans,poly-cis-decaprenylcistransferase [Sulfurospirillum sp.]|nr:di-trans,poly-cis-decaprenylcistransferase [Sulfurospirillum sp.]
MLKNQLSHLAIIMDGNGRWAQQQGKNRSFGHEIGAKNVRTITEYCAKRGIDYLTLYAFSTENWKRPQAEIQFLMKLLEKFLKDEQNALMQNNIRFTTIGDQSRFSAALQKQIQSLQTATAQNSGLTQILAINYGSKDEIIRAIHKFRESGLALNETNFTRCLDTVDFPEVDLLIRTGGEQRLSNFLLWQAAYAELYFTKTLWPDFSIKELASMIDTYKKISRKFGTV